MGLDPERVVEIWAQGATGGRVGSGYLVSGRHVLTAGHVVGSGCEVSPLGQERWLKARLAWSARDLDLALLEVIDPGWEAAEGAAPEWGRIYGGESLDFTAMGFPDSQVRQEGREEVRDTEQAGGRIQPWTTLKSGQLALKVEGGAPRDLKPGQSPWAGMSGAAVFADGLLVAVVVGDPTRFENDRLIATPVRLAADDEELGRELGALRLEPAPRIPGLAPWRRPLPSRWSPSTLLRAEHEVVVFRGREEELAEAERWCESPDGPVARLLVGPAGRGKSRYASELCRRMEERGWLTRLVSSEATAATLAAVSQLEVPALMVIDYAETRADLGQMLVAATESQASKVRVLLLARQAGDWWEQLKQESHDVEVALAGTEPRLLNPVDGRPAERQEAFTEAVAAFAEVQGLPVPEVRPPDLAGKEFDSILLVHMAALDAVGTPEDRGPGPAARGEADVRHELLNREARYWARSAAVRLAPDPPDEVVRRRAVAMATLLEPAGEEETAELLGRVPDLNGASPERRRRIARWLCWLGPLEPDALAEQLVFEVLRGKGRQPSELARKGFAGLGAGAAERALTILDRSAREHPELEVELEAILAGDVGGLTASAIRVAQQAGDPIGQVLARVLERGRAAEAQIRLLGWAFTALGVGIVIIVAIYAGSVHPEWLFYVLMIVGWLFVSVGLVAWVSPLLTWLSQDALASWFRTPVGAGLVSVWLVALLTIGSVAVGSITGMRPIVLNPTGPTVQEFPIPTPMSCALGITRGANNDIWFTEVNASQVGHLERGDSTPSEFRVTAGSGPLFIASGPNGNLFVTEYFASKIGVISPAGALLGEHPTLKPDSNPDGITVSADNMIWFTEQKGDKIGHMTPDGQMGQEILLPAGSLPDHIATGPDGNLWFTERGIAKIGRVTPTGRLLPELAIPSPGGDPLAIVTGPDHNLWFTEQDADAIGRVTPAGQMLDPIHLRRGARPDHIAFDRFGNAWVTERDANKIVRLDQTGRSLKEFVVPRTAINGCPNVALTGATPTGIASDGVNGIWFTEEGGNAIGMIDIGQHRRL